MTRATFDKFSEWAARQVGGSAFFIGCVVSVLLWLPTYFILDFTAWNFCINSSTTIVTFLLVALLQGSQNRNDKALHTKIDGLIASLPTDDKLQRIEDKTEREIDELHDAVQDIDA